MTQNPARRFRSRALPVSGLLFASLAPAGVYAQHGTGTLSGTVTDPTGARVPHARVEISCRKLETSLVADAAGVFSVSVPAGACSLIVRAAGFASLTENQIEVAPNKASQLQLQLALPELYEELTVPSDSSQPSGSGLVLNEEALENFSDDERTMQQELLALAGGDAQHEPAIYVDGFSNGRIPPRNTIRQVRLNANTFSSQYDSYGFGRMEVFTKPGGEKLHGSLEALANDSPWNARNPYGNGDPSYYALQLSGSLSGSFNPKTSFFLSGRKFNQRNNAVVNAVDITGPVAQIVPDPDVVDDYSARLDRQLNAGNTFTLRYDFARDEQSNAGVGQLVDASEGYNNRTTIQTLQAGETDVISPRLVSETRFQYVRTRVQQDAVSTEPTIIVQGSLNGGGSPAGSLRDNQDHYEFQEYVSLDGGSHFFRAGGRYRLTRDANTSYANYNGEFIYSSLAAYQAGQSSEYFVTRGQPTARILTGDVGLYAEDEWKARADFTVTYGLRFESQSALPDHADFAPRAAFAWSIPGGDKKPPLAVVRGGVGFFYSPFDAQNLLTSVRENGVSQQTLYGTDPVSALASTSTIYQVSPNLRRQYDIISSLAVEKSFAARGRVSVEFAAVRGVHQFLSLNANAPLPGTFDGAEPGSGVRPLGGTGNVYQYGSGGISKGRIVTVNAFLRPNRRLTISTVYYYERAFSNAAGAGSFASDSYDISRDYGQMAITPRHRLFASAGINLPWSMHMGAMLNATSGTPFNITTGTDLNGDSIYNDRPAYASDSTRASALDTRYGSFDSSPTAGQRIIPFDSAVGPSFASLQVSVSKAFPVGPKAAVKPGPQAAAQKADRPWELLFSLEADNALNETNPAIPIGVLSSPLFGKSISLAPGLSTNQAANRMVWLRGAFSF